jgi:hypothetical protein
MDEDNLDTIKKAALIGGGVTLVAGVGALAYYTYNRCEPTLACPGRLCCVTHASRLQGSTIRPWLER